MLPTRTAFLVLAIRSGIFALALSGAAALAAPPSPWVDRHGDPLPVGAIQRLGTERMKCGGEVQAVRFLADGKTAVVASGDSTCYWDMTSGRKCRELAGSSTSIASPADGKTLALAQGGKISLRDPATGRELRKFTANDTYLRSVAISADGKYLAGGGEPACVRLWELPSGKLLWKYDSGDGKVHALAFSPNGQTLAGTEGKQTVVLWDAVSGKELRRLQGSEPVTSDSRPAALAFFPDSRTLAHVCGPLYLWDTHTGKVQREEKAANSAYGSVALSPDGTVLAAEAAGVVRLWNVAPWKLRHEIHGHQESVRALAFAPDGRSLLAGDSARCLRVWDVVTGKDTLPLEGHGGKVVSVAFAADGRSVAAFSRGEVHLWDARTGQRRALLELHREVTQGTLRFSPCSQFLASANAVGPHLWRLPAGTPLAFFQGEEAHRPPEISSLAFSHDGKNLTAATNGNGRQLRWWPTVGGPELRRQAAPRNRLYALAFAPQGKTLTAVDSEHHVSLRDSATGQELHSFRLTGKPNRVVLAPDGSQAAAAYDSGDVYIWQATDGKPLRFIAGKEDAARCLAFSPDGRFLALATGYLGQSSGWGFRVCELLTGQEVWRCFGHQGEVRDLAFSADGRRVASASDDCTVLVWDTLPGLLPAVVLSDDDRAECWQDLAADAGRAYRAAGLLAADAPATVSYLAERLRPVPVVQPEKLRPLLTELNAESFAVREAAQVRLAELSEAALPALHQAQLAKLPVESRRRIEVLLHQAGEGIPSPDWLRGQRAIAVLERIGTPEARTLLETLGHGLPEARTTRHAQAALARLVAKPATLAK